MKHINEQNKKGKNYAIADIHGMYGSYMEVIRKLNNNDHLYIIGDIIDRGHNGIKIIQDIINRKSNPENNPKITCLMGNHELQFLYTINIMLKRNLTRADLITILNRRILQSKIGYDGTNTDNLSHSDLQKYEEQFIQYDEKYQDIRQYKGLSRFESSFIENWLYWNKGVATMFDFFQGKVVHSVQEQQAIYKFLYESYVALPQTINGKDYLFVHSMPPKQTEILRQMKKTGKGYRLLDLSIEHSEFILQERNQSTYKQCKEHGFITICGHTPKVGGIIKNLEEGFIRIDTACGHKLPNSKLALYCIDNGETQYIDELETFQEPINR